MSDEYRQAVREAIESAYADTRRIGEGSSGIFIIAVVNQGERSSVVFATGGHVKGRDVSEMLMRLPAFLQRAGEESGGQPQPDGQANMIQ